jgi:hypothetical protein
VSAFAALPVVADGLGPVAGWIFAIFYLGAAFLLVVVVVTCMVMLGLWLLRRRGAGRHGG